MKKLKNPLILFIVVLLIPMSNFVTNATIIEDDYIEEGIVEEYAYTSSVSSIISISGSSATCKSTILGNSYVTKIIIKQTLQKKAGTSWVNVVSWSNTFNSSVAVYSNKKNSLSSGTYRTHTSAKVYKGANYETVSSNSSTKTISL